MPAPERESLTPALLTPLILTPVRDVSDAAGRGREPMEVESRGRELLATKARAASIDIWLCASSTAALLMLGSWSLP